MRGFRSCAFSGFSFPRLPGYLSVVGAVHLTSIEGLEGITAVGGLELNSTIVTTLTGLQDLTSIA
eukprot:1545800-Alexandrium_andersonii.AAC.1